mgnify:CR=1 FL=1
MSDESTNQATQVVGTTEMLFGPQDDGASLETTPNPVETEKNEEPSQANRDDKGRFAAQKAAEPTVPDDEYLSVETLAAKKVKLKIGGQDSELTVNDLIRNVQTNQYLTQKGQRLAEEERRLQALKANTREPQANPHLNATVPDDEFTREFIDPKIAPYQQKVTELESILSSIAPTIGEMKYQSDLKKLDTRFKDEGLDDFLQYVPKIEQYILQQDSTNQQNLYTYEFFSDFYKTEKLKEMIADKKNPQKAETKLPDQRPKPRVVNVESGGGTATGNDDTNSLYNAAFKKAQESGNNRDWAEVIRLKKSG